MSLPKFTGPISYIQDWNTKRIGKSAIENLTAIFHATGNYFLLDTGNVSAVKPHKKFHIYIGLMNESIQLYALPSEVDIKISTFTQKDQIKSLEAMNLIPITPGFTNAKVEDNFSSRQDLVKRINNWLDPHKRESWLKKVYNSDPDKNTIVQTIEIDASDFKIGDVHACYFALKDEGEDGYRLDLVIANTGSNQIPDLILKGTPYDKTSVFEDMARPVPPFGQEGHTSTDQPNFGILNGLGIL